MHWLYNLFNMISRSMLTCLRVWRSHDSTYCFDAIIILFLNHYYISTHNVLYYSRYYHYYYQDIHFLYNICESRWLLVSETLGQDFNILTMALRTQFPLQRMWGSMSACLWGCRVWSFPCPRLEGGLRPPCFLMSKLLSFCVSSDHLCLQSKLLSYHPCCVL